MSVPGGPTAGQRAGAPDVIDAGSPIESSPTWRIEHPTTPEGAGLALPRRVVPAAEIAAAPGWRIAAVVGVACVVLGLSVVWRGDPSETVAGFWPPAGVGFVALLLVPRRRWGWVIAGILAPTVVGLASGAMSLRAGLIWGAANCVGPAVGASLLQRLSVAATPLQGRPLLTYLVCGPLVGPAVGGALGAIGSTLDYDQTWAGAWSAWILADGLGVLVVTSLVLVRLERPPQPRRPRELIVLTAFVLATAALTFVPLEGEASALLPYLVLVALVWAGMCFGPRLAGAAGFVVALAANVATSSELGPWSGSADGTGAIALQGFLVVAIVTSVVVGSMAAQLADRDEVNRLLRHQATHDALTGLPNRALLAEHLHRVLGDPDGDALGILLVDLDGFHEVNDRHGREVGDLVLRAVAAGWRSGSAPATAWPGSVATSWPSSAPGSTTARRCPSGRRSPPTWRSCGWTGCGARSGCTSVRRRSGPATRSPPRTSCTGPTWRWPGPSRSRPPRSPCSTRRWRPAPAASPS